MANTVLHIVLLLTLFNRIEGNNHPLGWLVGRDVDVLWKNNQPCFLSRNVNNNNHILESSNTLRSNIILSQTISSLRGGAALNPFPAGYNPFGYSLTEFGKKFLDFDGSLDSDIGRFLSTLKGGQRKTAAVMKEQWLEIVRVSKKAQSMRIYRKLDDMIEFCLKAGFID